MASARIVIVRTIAAVSHGYHPTMLLDEWSQDLLDIGEAVFNQHAEYSDEVRDWAGGRLLLGDLLIRTCRSTPCTPSLPA